jgi:hypothetical protein
VLKAQTLFGAVAVPARFRERADKGTKVIIQITIERTIGEASFFAEMKKPPAHN